MAVHKALQKEKDVVWQCKEVIKPQSCQSFCVFRWVPAAYSTFVSLSLFFFWKLLILDFKKDVFKNYFYFLLVSTRNIKSNNSKSLKWIGTPCSFPDFFSLSFFPLFDPLSKHDQMMGLQSVVLKLGSTFTSVCKKQSWPCSPFTSPFWLN